MNGTSKMSKYNVDDITTTVYDEFLKSIIALGVRFGQENTNKNVEDVTDYAFKALMIAFKGKNYWGVKTR